MVSQQQDYSSSSRSVTSQAQSLRQAIESLINAKLHDALAHPGGLDRLMAHRRTGVASYDIRMAERRLEQALTDVLLTEGNVETAQ